MRSSEIRMKEELKLKSRSWVSGLTAALKIKKALSGEVTLDLSFEG